MPTAVAAFFINAIQQLQAARKRKKKRPGVKRKERLQKKNNEKKSEKNSKSKGRLNHASVGQWHRLDFSVHGNLPGTHAPLSPATTGTLGGGCDGPRP
jgi:hypothetical protein